MHPIIQEYVDASKEVAASFKPETCESSKSSRRYKLALLNIRTYLDRIGCKMPPPTFIYNRKDTKTWKYSDTILKGEAGSGYDVYVGMIENPEFVF